jgi:hypothetical protein
MQAPPIIQGEPRQVVARYFFSVQRLDGEDLDPCGAALPDDAAALDFALSMIKRLIIGAEHDQCGLMMIVRNENLKRVLSLPFLAGCA